MNEIKSTPPNHEKENASKKLTIIALSLFFLALCLLIVDIVIIFTKHSGENSRPPGESISLNSVGEASFESLTKDQAYEIVGQFISGKNGILSEILPEYDGFKDENYQNIEMFYSYDNPKDFILERNKYCIEGEFGKGRPTYAGQDIVITLETPYYTLAKAPKSGGCDVWDRDDLWISFDKKYLDYSMQETSPNNYDDIVKFNDLNRESVSKISPIVAYGTIRSPLEHYIYSTELLENSEKYILVINLIDANLNMEAMDNYYRTGNSGNNNLMAINLYRMYLEITKATGKVSWRENNANKSKYFTYKSYPLTQTELDAIKKTYQEAF